MVLTSKRLILYFNPRSHERSDCYSNISLTFSSYFNPRSHERSDATTLRQGIYRLNFNPRSHERSDLCNISLVYIVEYFNPRSHERSDNSFHYFLTPFNISIHAPTRGATSTASARLLLSTYFNPRSHERSDSNIAQKICLFLYNTDNKYIIR